MKHVKNKPAKTITCATILLSKDKKHILVGKIGLQKKYDLPKGRMETGESEIETAIRELKEETGLVIDKFNYVQHQKNSIRNLFFNKDKNISIFFIYDKDNIWINDENMNKLKCSTYFTLNENKNNPTINMKQYPELEGFKKVDIHEILNSSQQSTIAYKLFNKSMAKVLLSKLFKNNFYQFVAELD